MTVGRAQWTWQFLDADGAPLEGGVDAPEPPAASRYDAEQWLGESWRVLAAEGAVRAVLRCDGAVVGPGVELRPYAG
jgi:hypothetical protein